MFVRRESGEREGRRFGEGCGAGVVERMWGTRNGQGRSFHNSHFIGSQGLILQSHQAQPPNISFTTTNANFTRHTRGRRV